ncbi:hypothetical protein RM190_02780 [Paracoccus sp. CPCC 101403]|uniref:Uncharacterized protein n=2 Tax=Paracoccus broussonetiae TaxID=3075834 RepID=A0ABU3E970_9RHOB|nr:hypothetical protein [Paracoccus sp. CPCC 101403]MDT1060765.1 hypothetical protein [Paracoccus sp. CPCC 101403]
MKTPPNPHLVLVSAILLPGSGQVWNGVPLRGLTFLFFACLLGGFTILTAPPEASFIGRNAGGFFVWAMAVFDAYKQARIRHAVWQHRAA